MREDNEFAAINTVVSSKPQWQTFAASLENWDALVDTQGPLDLTNPTCESNAGHTGAIPIGP
jgi:hypothetical protein